MLFGALLLALIVVGTASLLRVGRTLLDRLMAAVAVVAGVAVAAGYAFTFWPWGLNPYAVAAVALLALGGAALISGRRPSLPRRLLGSDLILLAGTVFATLVAAWPTLHSGSLAERLSYSAITGDRMRHFNLFDGILHIGGYPFLNYDAAAPIVQDDIAKVYPQSAHYLYALIDSFLTGGSGPGDALASYDRYYAYVVAGFAFLALASAWAVRWVAGPGTGGWRRSLAMSAAASVVAAGVLTTAIWCSFDPQVLSTAFLVVAAAFLARGPRGPIEHLVIGLSASVVAVSAYPLFALFLAPVGICAVVVYRRRFRRHWIACTSLVAAAAVIVLVPTVMAQTAGLETGEHLLLEGYVVRPSWMLMLTLIGLAVAGLCVRNSRRSPVRRVYGIGVAAACVPLIAIGAYQLSQIGFLTYYFDKGAQTMLVLLLVAAGISVRWLRFGPATGGRRLALASVAAVALGAVAAGAVSIGPIQFDRDEHALGGDTTWGRVWASGEFYRGPHAPALAYLTEHGYLEGPATVAITSPDPGTNANVSVGLAVLQHDLGALRTQVYATGYAPADLSPLELAIVASPVPLRLVTNDAAVAEHFIAYGADNPQLEFSVVLDEGVPQ
ncbi:hypothetical protein [Phytomonospora endophytica]|uniref:Glycosyltransferase RgtA/B/C/D-like domain-containing protein n=1 Tax=Phytomonospora endophytica TaxID=714109 RepID=A0A841G2A3_9ACTN|nr:hypothetical protein [Phytomonospora endophytica]MBB6039777.1 hypothetical protein [Phytomonospora endophytica]GIG70886.1 hypothetical protein Pen01_71810 [Phytomonospora endophytica]